MATVNKVLFFSFFGSQPAHYRLSSMIVYNILIVASQIRLANELKKITTAETNALAVVSVIVHFPSHFAT